MNTTLSFSLHDIDQVAQKLVPFVHQARVVALQGDLGAGKTTLIRACVQALGCTQPVTSPTFNYVHRYMADDGTLIYHFDLYRLKELDAFYQAGFDEYLYDPQALVFIEWPELIQPLLPTGTQQLVLAADGIDSERRVLTMQIA